MQHAYVCGEPAMKLLITLSLIGTTLLSTTLPALSRELSPMTHPKTRSYTGLTYRALPQGFQDDGGWVIKGGRYGGDFVQRDQVKMLWLTKLLKWNRGGAVPRKVVDVLELPILSKSQKLHYAFCRLNGTYDREIIAIAEATNTEFRTNIYQAWRANTKTEKIEPISPEGIACENSSWRRPSFLELPSLSPNET
jgi:hypothetical protein